MAYLSIVACVILGAFYTLLSKKFQTSFSESLLNFVKYNLLNAFCACFFLFAINLFRIDVNLTTFLYALVYALVVICILTLNFFAYKFVSVSLVSLLSTSGAIILPTLFTVFYLDYKPSITIIISVILMIIATVIPYIGTKQKFSKATIPVCLAFFVISGANSIVLKLFTLEKTATDSVSLFILTNAIIVAIALLLLGFFALLRRNSLKELIHPFPLKTTLNVVTRTAISNLSSVLSAFAIALMSLPVYSVTTSSIGMFSAFILSLFIFKEKFSIAQTISLLITICALIISIF